MRNWNQALRSRACIVAIAAMSVGIPVTYADEKSSIVLPRLSPGSRWNVNDEVRCETTDSYLIRDTKTGGQRDLKRTFVGAKGGMISREVVVNPSSAADGRLEGNVNFATAQQLHPLDVQRLLPTANDGNASAGERLEGNVKFPAAAYVSPLFGHPLMPMIIQGNTYPFAWHANIHRFAVIRTESVPERAILETDRIVDLLMGAGAPAASKIGSEWKVNPMGWGGITGKYLGELSAPELACSEVLYSETRLVLQCETKASGVSEVYVSGRIDMSFDASTRELRSANAQIKRIRSARQRRTVEIEEIENSDTLECQINFRQTQGDTGH